MENVKAAASNPIGRMSQFGTQLGEGFTSGSLGGFKDALYADYTPTAALADAKNIAQPIAQGDTLSQIAQTNNTTVEALMTANPNITDPNMIIAGESINIPQVSAGGTALSDSVVKTGTEVAGAGADDASRSFLEKTGDFMFRGGQSPEAIAGVQDAAGKEYLTKMAASGIAPTEAGLKAAQAAAGPGLLTRFGPSALAGTAVAAGAGFFDVPEMEQATFLDYNSDGTLVTGRDLIDADPGKYLVKNLGQIQLNEETGEYEPITTDLAIMGEDTVGYVPPEQVAVMPRIDPQQYLTSSTPGGPFARPYVTQGYQSAAEGGPIFPRRNGGIAPNEGTPGEDSVRAMLMPGEFVMTTDAVRGLGNGNLNNGIKNMYSVMRNLESRGRQMA